MQHYPGKKKSDFIAKAALSHPCALMETNPFQWVKISSDFSFTEKTWKRTWSTDYFSKLFMKVICLNLLIQLIWSKTCLITELLIWSSPRVRSSFCQCLQKESLKRDMKVKCLFALLISLPGLFTECFHYEAPSASWEG